MEKKYPGYFKEPIRREIAISQFQHDLRKLLPSLPVEDWEKIDYDINRWYLGEPFELEPIHDFWNLFGGFARGLKLKSLLSWVTAENVVWSRAEASVDDIEITWDFPGLEFMSKAPYQASEVKQKLEQLPEIKHQILLNSEMRSNRYAPRDQFPIILFHDTKGGVICQKPGYYVLEGNRRTVRAIVKDLDTIPAYIGRFRSKKDKWPSDYWFSTGMLRDIIFLAMGYEKNHDEEAFRLCRKFYQLLLRDFDIARIATIDKSFKNFEKSERLLLDLLLEDMK